MERNAQVFRHQYSTAAMVIGKIKEKARAWSLASAKIVSNVVQYSRILLKVLRLFLGNCSKTSSLLIKMENPLPCFKKNK